MSETKPRIGLVLGSGGARGLAHIIAFETFDRLGIRPVEIAGASIGAILGAAYASGFSGLALRQHALREFRKPDRGDDAAFPGPRGAHFRSLAARFDQSGSGGWHRNARTLPAHRPAPSFRGSRYPAFVVAADLHRMERVVFREGLLAPAVAASMAIPGLVRPVVHEGRVMIDGGAVDPLPIRAIQGRLISFLRSISPRPRPRRRAWPFPARWRW